MRPYLLLAVIGIVGCAFGQSVKSARKMPSCTYSGVEVSGDLRTNCVPKSMGQKPAKVEWQIVDTNTTNTPQAEAIDVPAIQEKRHNGKIGFAHSDEECKKNGGTPMGEQGSALRVNRYCEDMLETVTTCADKERILEHSESGKYYCRKVQP